MAIAPRTFPSLALLRALLTCLDPQERTRRSTRSGRVSLSSWRCSSTSSTSPPLSLASNRLASTAQLLVRHFRHDRALHRRPQGWREEVAGDGRKTGRERPSSHGASLERPDRVDGMIGVRIGRLEDWPARGRLLRPSAGRLALPLRPSTTHLDSLSPNPQLDARLSTSNRCSCSSEEEGGRTRRN